MLNFQLDHEIRAHFEGFGPVDTIEYHLEVAFPYCFVQFNTADSARAALSQKEHSIGFQMKVKEAELFNHPDYEPHPLLKPPTQYSAKQILNALDDDSLREVFRKLSLNDLVTHLHVHSLQSSCKTSIFN